MILRDLHVHTTYCDGQNSPEEMVISAIDKGLECIGFSGHSYTFFDTRYCIKKEKIADYISEINALKEKYKDKQMQLVKALVVKIMLPQLMEIICI